MTSVDSQLMLANSLCLRLEDPIGAVWFEGGAVLVTSRHIVHLTPFASRSFAGAMKYAG